jgi:hypothetical protein
VIANFKPQPYPLWAVVIEKVDDPPRLQPADDAVRLVLGWSQAEGDNEPRPVLAGTDELPHPPLVMYEPNRADAEELAKRFAKYARSDVRSAAVLNAVDTIEKKVEAFYQRVEKKIDAFEKRVSGTAERPS